MKNLHLGKKVRQDTDKVKNDISALVGDSVARMNRIEDNVSQATGKAKEDLTTWVEDSVSQLNEGVDKLTGDVKHVVVDTAVTMKKDVGHELSQYNAKAQKVADKVPGDFGKKVTVYPWVAISIALGIGFLLGFLFRPARYMPDQL